LVSDSLVGAVKNWAVSDEHSFSDHRFIETVLSLDSPLPVSFANPRRADWLRYKEVLTNILPMAPSESITNPQELDGTVYKFTEACNTVFKVACPTWKPRGRKKPPWWTQQLSTLRTNCRCLFNRAMAGNEDTNWLNYKYKISSYKKDIRRAKRTAWQTFCSDIEKTTDAARLRKILSKIAEPLGYLQKANGVLLDAHFPGSQQAGHPPERGAGEGIELDPLLSDRNMKWSIHSFRPYKSPGLDRITPAHIQQARQIAINWLKKIFQSILAVGELPTAWQETKVVFIPKAGKATHTTAKDFKK